MGGEDFESGWIIFEVDRIVAVTELDGWHESARRMRANRPQDAGAPTLVLIENTRCRHGRNGTCHLQILASPSAKSDGQRQTGRAASSATLLTASTEKLSPHE